VFFLDEDADPPSYRRISEGDPIYIWPRLIYSPADDSGLHFYDEALLAGDFSGVGKWSDTGAVVYKNPLFNLFDPDALPPWPASRLPKNKNPGDLVEKVKPLAMDIDAYISSVTNATSDVVVEFKERLGTPWYFPNRPLCHAAELAYLFDDPVSSTNIILGIDQKHTARMVDCFAAIPPHITPDSPPAFSNALTRVNPNTPYADVLAPLLAFNPTDPAFLFDRALLPGPFKNPVEFTNAWLDAREETNGRGWNCNAQFLPDFAAQIPVENETDRRLLNDLLVHVAPQISFRQNAYVVIIQAQRLSPKGRPLASQRAAFTVIRDAFTGQWLVYQTTWLTEK
jgi:hypothetical protein